jgi:hypothetical protein
MKTIVQPSQKSTSKNSKPEQPCIETNIQGKQETMCKNWLEVDYSVGFSMDARNYMLERKKFNIIVRTIKM